MLEGRKGRERRGPEGGSENGREKNLKNWSALSGQSMLIILVRMVI